MYDTAGCDLESSGTWEIIMHRACVKLRAETVGNLCEVNLQAVEHQRVMTSHMAVDDGGNGVQPGIL